MNRTSGAASINGTELIVFWTARILAHLMSAPEARGPEETATSDKNRVRDRPGDLDPLADGAPADRRARGFLQDDRRAVARLQHVAAALAGKPVLRPRDAQPVVRRTAAPSVIGEAQTLRPGRQHHLLAGGGTAWTDGTDQRALAFGHHHIL